MKGKKGEGLAISTIITLILIIIGFAIILFVIYQINWTGTIDREVCHQSVIFRASLTPIAGIRDYVPLKCKTEKICVTAGLFKGDCEEFENIKGVTKIRTKDIEDVEQIIARDVLDCWKTMGEGKIGVFSPWLAQKFGVGTIYPSCVICSRIAFDKEGLEKAGINIDDMDILRYMQNHATPTSTNLSYYQYFAREGGKYKVDKELEIIEIEEEGGEVITGDGIDIEVGDLEPIDSENKELAVLFMQITAPTHSGVFKNTLTTLGIGYGLSFVMAPRATLGSTKALGHPLTLAILAIAGIYQHGSVAYNKAVSAGYCGDVSIGNKAREGCSVVRTVNYDAEAISEYCSKIESIP